MHQDNFTPQHWPPAGRGALAEHRRGGLREGKAICLYEHGSVAWEGRFRRDAPCGHFRFFAPDGRLVAERYFPDVALRLPTFMQEASCVGL